MSDWRRVPGREAYASDKLDALVLEFAPLTFDGSPIWWARVRDRWADLDFPSADTAKAWAERHRDERP